MLTGFARTVIIVFTMVSGVGLRACALPGSRRRHGARAAILARIQTAGVTFFASRADVTGSAVALHLRVRHSPAAAAVLARAVEARVKLLAVDP